MTWSLERPIRVGSTTFAAIVETEISARNTFSYLRFAGQKRPRVVLIAWEHRIKAIDLKGRVLEAGDVDVRYPGAIAQLSALV
ncbi:hypothetical protein [Boseongicola aestuarii]|uniref:Uncharacterized protein n=1 Tax=Boseongicola aestuarii TaxID=1470561 RepID=A0A238IUC2_9RHOB|nr:hypothetical protein [Boseongicola aestuarii]SMX21978.1 hypothetical protein BOA8489_00065 [Boseongicola aestuarii]